MAIAQVAVPSDRDPSDRNIVLAVDDNEIEANQFAAELLMPHDLIRRDLKKLPSDIEPETAVAQLARRYQVSIQAMTIRLNGLGVLA